MLPLGISSQKGETQPSTPNPRIESRSNTQTGWAFLQIHSICQWTQ